ncbi:MAG: hypothetical protein M3O34_03085 [Chloroflexota bacterium]|nr:hypothetical protein [Chloroflexota bacterium]
MNVLAKLTLIYAGVLVSAVGSSLVGILVYLRRIRTALGETRQALAEVRDDTAPLGGHIGVVHAATVDVATGLEAARASLARVDEGLDALTGGPGAGATAR